MSEILIPIDLIDANPYQPRKQEDPQAVEELALDILHHATPDFDGLMQVPTVRAVNGRYQLAFGHTRKAAFAFLVESGQSRYEEMRVNVRELDDVQMFELAVAENIKRRDLNPIEQADAMRRYMDEFGKTSKEAGEFFGVAEETVRQKVRLLKLPESVQAKMRKGEINENTARSLLSMQKIANNDALVKTVRKIEESREDATPEEVIERALEHLPDVVDMWDDNRRDGKPRSAWSNGWPLDMKNFPVQFLPAMSEQQVGVHEKNIEHLVNPPACTACKFYTKMRGSHYCGLKICHERKTVAWYQLTINQSSKEMGIPLYEKKDGRFEVLDSSDHQALFNSRHKGLRLLPANQYSKSVYQYFDGIHREVGIVVATGEAIARMKSRGSRIAGTKMTEAEKAEMRRMKVYRRLRREFMWEFTGVAKSIFDGVPYEALLKISRWEHVLMDDQPPAEVVVPDNAKVDEQKAEYLRRMIVWRLIMNESSHYHRKSMADMLKDFEKHAKVWGVKLPKSLIKQSADWDVEIKAAGDRRPK